MFRVAPLLLTAVLLSVTADPAVAAVAAVAAKRRTVRASKKQSNRSSTKKPPLKGTKTKVRYTTRKRAYFAQGKDDGLERGDAVRARGANRGFLPEATPGKDPASAPRCSSYSPSPSGRCAGARLGRADSRRLRWRLEPEAHCISRDFSPGLG